MGLFSWMKRTPPPTDKTARWIHEQIRERARSGDAVGLAEACETLGGQGSMLFGMVMPAALVAREQLHREALEALRARIPTLADAECDPVFAVVTRANLPVDIAERRAKLAGARRRELDRATSWFREQIQARASANDIDPLVDAAAAFAARRGMAFGMVIGGDPGVCLELRDACLAVLRERLPSLSDRQTQYVLQTVQRAHLPLEVADIRAELAAKHQAEHAHRLEAAAGTEPRNAELEAAIAANPDDEGCHLVLADWLQTQGHPRGELLALQLRAESDVSLQAAAAAHLEAHADALLGPLTQHQRTHDGTDRDAFAWRRGYIHRAVLSYDENVKTLDQGLAEILELLLVHPSGSRLAELALGINGEAYGHTLDDLIAILVARAPASLRALHLGDFEYSEQTEMSWYTVGVLTPLWAAAQQLRRLIVQGGSFALGVIELPVLEHAEFRTGGLDRESANAIATAHWPALRFLDVWYGDPEYGEATLDDALPLLARRDLPALAHLGLKNASFTDELCARVARAPLAAQLDELDLSLGTMSDAGAELLIAAAPELPRLARLDVSRNYLTEPAIAGLRRAFREVVAADQGVADDEDDRRPSVGE